jgi:hypothetical protein
VLKATGGPTALKPRAVSNNQVNVRIACVSSVTTGWQNEVDVDMDGQIDDSTKDEKHLDVDCRV